MSSIKNFITSYDFLSFMALVTYWVPLAICFTVYFFRWVKAYQIDLKASVSEHYRPTLTVGDIIWGLILAFTPCINLLALVFDCAGSVFRWIGSVFDFALVRHRYVEPVEPPKGGLL